MRSTSLWMIGGLIGAGLGLGTVTSCSRSVCQEDPTLPGCLPLTVDPDPEISRAIGSQLKIHVPQLADNARPTIQIQSLQGGDSVELTLESITQGVITARLLNPARLGLGTATVTVRLGIRPPASGTTRVYAEPQLRSGPSLAYTAPSKALSVFIDKPASGTQGWLYVGEETTKVVTERYLARYQYQNGVLAVDSTFSNTLRVSDSPALFGLGRSVGYLYYYRFASSKWVMLAANLSGSPMGLDGSVQLQDAKLFAVDRERDVAYLQGLNATQPSLESFRFNLSAHLEAATATLAETPALLAARHFDDGSHQLDVVAYGSGGPVVYSRGTSSPFALTKAEDLTRSLTNSIAQSKTPATALTLADIDQDGQLDVVFLAPETTGGTVKSMSWIPYVGGGQFGSIHSVPLPATQNGVVAISVDDVNGDGVVDLSVATSATVSLFLNQ